MYPQHTIVCVLRVNQALKFGSRFSIWREKKNMKQSQTKRRRKLKKSERERQLFNSNQHCVSTTAAKHHQAKQEQTRIQLVYSNQLTLNQHKVTNSFNINLVVEVSWISSKWLHGIAPQCWQCCGDMSNWLTNRTASRTLPINEKCNSLLYDPANPLYKPPMSVCCLRRWPSLPHTVCLSTVRQTGTRLTD